MYWHPSYHHIPKIEKELENYFLNLILLEIYVKAKMESVRLRDPKGLYLKAEKEKYQKFYWYWLFQYEEPQTPELTLNTDELEPEESVSNTRL